MNIDYSIRHPLSANEDNNDNMIQMERGRPIDLLGSGHHFNDAPRHRRHNEHIICPMDNMFDRVLKYKIYLARNQLAEGSAVNEREVYR